MHDTLEVFGAHLPEMRDLWRCTVSPQLPPRSTNKLSKAAENHKCIDVDYWVSLTTIVLRLL
jgi:hypothetical protein